MMKSVYLAVSTMRTLTSPYFMVPSSGQYCSHFFCKTHHDHQVTKSNFPLQGLTYSRVSKHWYGCQCLLFLTCLQMLMCAAAHVGSTNIVRASALKEGSRGKVPCCTGESNLHQQSIRTDASPSKLPLPPPPPQKTPRYDLCDWLGIQKQAQGSH